MFVGLRAYKSDSPQAFDVKSVGLIHQNFFVFYSIVKSRYPTFIQRDKLYKIAS